MWSHFVQSFANLQWPALFAIAVALIFVGGSAGETNIDPMDKFGWCENTGFLNFRDAGNGDDGASVTPRLLAGFVWAENAGWINLGDGSPADGVHYANTDASEFGVNVNASGELYGFAWGENVGWINFDTRTSLGPHGQQARLDLCANRLRGFAWGENVGWINLDDSERFVALGPICDAGDAACDGVIALIDYVHFQNALTGPGTEAACPVFDLDGDSDVDLADFSRFQTVFTGA